MAFIIRHLYCTLVDNIIIIITINIIIIALLINIIIIIL